MKYKFFVVNLPSSTYRKKEMQKQLEKLKIPFEFVNALDGKTLSQEKIDKLFDVSYPYNRTFRKTEIACILSHKAAMEKAVAQDVEFAVILEDDVLLSKRFTQIIDRLTDMMQARQIVLLHNTPVKRINLLTKANLHGEFNFCSPESLDDRLWLAQGYVLKRETAQDIASNLLPVKNVFDDWLLYKELNLVDHIDFVFPFPVNHAEYPSDLNIELDSLQKGRRIGYYDRLKYFVYKNRIWPFYQLFLKKRQYMKEQDRIRFLTLDGNAIKRAIFAD